MAPRLTLLLPGYNEEANVREAVERCDAALSRLVPSHEILVIDDGSLDATAAIAEELAKARPNVRLIKNPINLGVGISLLVGMRAASGELVVHNAMDYPFDLEDLTRILPLFPEADVVAVTRLDRSAHSTYRKLTSLVHYWLVRLLFRVSLRDMNFVQVYKREALEALRVRAKSPAFVTPELLIRAQDAGLKIAEVDAPFHPRLKGSPSYGKTRDILWTLSDMVSFWIERRRGRSQAKP